jgi:hypothetical protein
MALTRFNDDPCRITKKLQQMTDPGRWILNMPGNGDKPCFIADPQILLQGWGANLRSNTINLESDLLNVNRPLNKDCLGKNEYQKYNVPNKAIEYPTCTNVFTEQSRAIMPAWTARDLEQVNWYPLILDPQENTCLPFQNNLSTRILEKDYFQRSIEYQNQSVFPDSHKMLPQSTEKLYMNALNGRNICNTTSSI